MKASHIAITVVLLVIACLSFLSMYQVLEHEDTNKRGWSDKSSSREHVLDQRNRAANQYTKLLEDELQYAREKFQQVTSKAYSLVHSSHNDFSLSSSSSSASFDIAKYMMTNVTDDGVENPIDPYFQDWKRSIYRKLKCTYQHRTLYYMYHIRKAAGTTIRDLIKASNQRYFVQYEETEGRTLNPELLGLPHVFTVTSLRDPIDRILSMYWYEHVGWFHGVLRQTERCKPLREWVSAWQDGTPFKKSILREDPRSNYIEVENYYTKAFSNWDGKSPLGSADLVKAKETLLKFDIVLISDWLGDETQVDAINAVFSGRTNLVTGSKLKGNSKMRDQLRSSLSPDEDEVRMKLRKLNEWDLKLYDFALSLASWRLKHVVPIVRKLRGHVHVHGVHGNSRRRLQSAPNSQSLLWTQHDAVLRAEMHMCDGFSDDIKEFQRKYRSEFGIFRPENHKGP
jgi:hypothetical protein